MHISGISFVFDQVNLSNSIYLIGAIFILTLIFSFWTYKSRTRLGFVLRKKVQIFPTNDLSDYKSQARILFIDDNDFRIAETLKDDGWKVKKVADARIDDQKVKEANIIFVDWKGVGKKISTEEEGIALVQNLKNKYKHKKYVILYSAQEYVKPEKIAADSWINKGSPSSKYIESIQKGCFCLFP